VLQADGYNQLTVANAFFKIHDEYRITQVSVRVRVSEP